MTEQQYHDKTFTPEEIKESERLLQEIKDVCQEVERSTQTNLENIRQLNEREGYRHLGHTCFEDFVASLVSEWPDKTTWTWILLGYEQGVLEAPADEDRELGDELPGDEWIGGPGPTGFRAALKRMFLDPRLNWITVDDLRFLVRTLDEYDSPVLDVVAEAAFSMGRDLDRRAEEIGKKVRRAGREAHERVYGTEEEKRARWEQWRRMAQELMESRGFSVTKARRVVGKRVGVTPKTVERHTKGLNKKKGK